MKALSLYLEYTNLAAVSFDSTAVVSLLATANATSEMRAGELPCGVQIQDSARILTKAN